MSRAQREQQHHEQRRSKYKDRNPYTSRIVKAPTKRDREDSLRHAVTHHDYDAFEDYDEWESK